MTGRWVIVIDDHGHPQIVTITEPSVRITLPPPLDWASQSWNELQENHAHQ